MPKTSQLDRALADINKRIDAVNEERTSTLATFEVRFDMLNQCVAVLMATKQATAKLKGASKRKPKEQAPGQ